MSPCVIHIKVESVDQHTFWGPGFSYLGEFLRPMMTQKREPSYLYQRKYICARRKKGFWLSVPRGQIKLEFLTTIEH